MLPITGISFHAHADASVAHVDQEDSCFPALLAMLFTALISMPAKAITHATNATVRKKTDNFCRNSIGKILCSRCEATLYMARGNTRLQTDGPYLNLFLSIVNFHTSRMRTNGIHTEAIPQNI